MSHWIKGYNPQWISDKDEAIRLLQSYAAKWVGHCIEETWIGLLPSDKTWWKDLPITIKINGILYGISWWKFDEFTITENQINVRNCWVGGGRVPMRKNHLEPLNNALGKRILAIELGESEMSIGAWHTRMINSINFILEDGYLTIFNALDENGIDDKPCLHDIHLNTAIIPSSPNA